MKSRKKKSAFTLLEIIIVIIIVGILASLALPRFFSTVEYSKSTEAFAAIRTIRQALERCYLQRTGTYAGCTFGVLDIDNPVNSPNAHFNYGVGSLTATGYVITATRLSRDGGVVTHTISLTQTLGGVTRGGTTAFSGVQ